MLFSRSRKGKKIDALLPTPHIFEGIKQSEKYAPQLLGYFMRTFPTLLVYSDSRSSYSNCRNIFRLTRKVFKTCMTCINHCTLNDFIVGNCSDAQC